MGKFWRWPFAITVKTLAKILASHISVPGLQSCLQLLALAACQCTPLERAVMACDWVPGTMWGISIELLDPGTGPSYGSF